MTIYNLNGIEPQLSNSAYVHESATIIGNCILGDYSTVWPNAVVRGDNDNITIGHNTNIQDGAVIHVDQGHPAKIGDGVSIAHLAMIHGATIGDNTLIGMHAIVMNDAVIGKNCIIGANTTIASGKVIPDNSMVVGTPGKIIREITEEESNSIHMNALGYVGKGVTYRLGLKKVK
jgi:carbonic anhydrase/acetyltransferase-like protein (isoleucine patch superfamily)